jgi:putative dehydrogenase
MTAAASAPLSVAIVGVGNMGAGMARRLLSLGWSVHVCDLDAVNRQSLVSFGALVHDLPAQAATDSIVVIVAVVDAVQTEMVLFGEHGIAHVIAPGQTVLLCPRWRRRMSRVLPGGSAPWACT